MYEVAMYAHLKLKFQQTMHTDNVQMETHSLPLYWCNFGCYAGKKHVYTFQLAASSNSVTNKRYPGIPHQNLDNYLTAGGQELASAVYPYLAMKFKK